MAGIIGSRAGLDETAAWAAAETMNQELTDSGKAYNEAADFYILGQGWGNWTSEEGLPAAEDLLVANAAKVNLVLGENDNMLLGAMTAIENAGLMEQVYIAAAADGQKEAYKLIKDGTKYIVTGLNAPPVIARGAVDIAIDILVNGVDPASYELTTTTPPAAITIENVDEFYDPNANF
jgi:ribose transport system substrate-binding protein